MAVLDPIPDPSGGYLAVYDSPFGSPAGASAAAFRVSLARSMDLIHWTRVAILDSSGANSPTLRSVPDDRGGYVLAYEKYARSHPYDHVRVRYYRDLSDVLANRFAAQVDLPRRDSRFNNGTPDFRSIAWHGSLRRSVLELGFHYETTLGGHPGPDREALGIIRGFRTWYPVRNSAADLAINAAGFRESHGLSRQFSFGGRFWRVYEGESIPNDFGSWHVLLYDVRAKGMYPLTMRTAVGTSSTSFGVPTAQVEPNPGGRGQVLVVTMFIFGSGGASSRAGELVYYQPI
ncbi:MAG: hypothetical protein M3Z27_00245 [Actinomycetota bacterium]|nr:hypothetical protein [Actinomycetota bacterium]